MKKSKDHKNEAHMQFVTYMCNGRTGSRSKKLKDSLDQVRNHSNALRTTTLMSKSQSGLRLLLRLRDCVEHQS